MKKSESITYKQLERVSPSQYSSMKNCSYKSILARAFNRKTLLPISPNAYFGTVIHNVLERLNKFGTMDEPLFNSVFSDEIEAMEEKLKKEGYEFLVPLQKNVQNFGMRKILLKKHIKSELGSSKPPGNCKPTSEQWISTNDNLVGGYVDLILDSNNYVELVDFKTGAITQDVLDDSGEIFTEIKAEYSDQLKLYAYCYFESRGRYPDKLTIVDLANKRIEVSFTHEECMNLYNEAIAMLKAINQGINNQIFVPRISEDNCKYCLYRSACIYYNSYIENNTPFNDLIGNLENVVKYQNGNISISIKNNSGAYIVTGIENEDYSKLLLHQGNKIGIYNLKKESKEMVYSSRKTTVIYEH